MNNSASPQPQSTAPTVFAVLAVILLVTACAALMTHGFKAWTTEALRRQLILENPMPLPSLLMNDHLGQQQALNKNIQTDGRIVLINFIYTRCNSVCRILGAQFQQAQAQIQAHGLQDKVRLLSISFDPSYDTPAQLAKYAINMHADPAIWHFASVANPSELPQLLKQFGIVVIPDGYGGFIHNAAIHAISADAKLEHIYDLDDFDVALATALKVSQ